MYLAWNMVKSLGRHVDNESIPLKIIIHLCFKSSSSGTFANQCFPLRRAYLLLSSTYLYARVMVIFTTSYILPFSLGKHHVLGNDLDIYIHTNIFDHELLLLTIIYMINKLGGETLSPYLSLCSMDAICSKNMLWVTIIMEDYMIVEYVEFAKSKLLHRPFLKIRWIAIVRWLGIWFVSFQETFWSIL